MSLSLPASTWTAIAAVGGPAVAVVAVYLAFRLQIRATRVERLRSFLHDAIGDLTQLYLACGSYCRLVSERDTLVNSGDKAPGDKWAELAALASVVRGSFGLSGVSTGRPGYTTGVATSGEAFAYVEISLSLLYEKVSGLRSRLQREVGTAFLVGCPPNIANRIDGIATALGDVAIEDVDSDDKALGLVDLPSCGRAIAMLKDEIQRLDL